MSWDSRGLDPSLDPSHTGDNRDDAEQRRHHPLRRSSLGMPFGRLPSTAGPISANRASITSCSVALAHEPPQARRVVRYGREMTGATRAASGPAAGYQYQIQRALLELLGSDGENPSVALEALDDVVVVEDGITTLEQLKHSVNPGTLTDASPQWWRALDVWMDIDATLAEPDQAHHLQLRLVTTATARTGSAAAFLRQDQLHDTTEAERLLLETAFRSRAASTAAARRRFRGEGPDGLSDDARRALMNRIVVLDAQPPVGDFIAQLRARLRVGLPLHGADHFLSTVIGRWDDLAVDLLLGRRQSVSRSELHAEIA